MNADRIICRCLWPAQMSSAFERIRHSVLGAQEKTRMESWVLRMRALQGHDGDTEIQHQMADEILCEVLLSLGCDHIVNEWRKVHKWYS